MTKVIQYQFEERPYRMGDLNALEQIEKDAGNASWSRYQIKAMAQRLTMDTRLITAVEAFDQPIGFYVVEHGDDALYISNLAVAQNWRRCGVASFALEAAANMAMELNYPKLSLHVQEENLPAQLLYRKAGFKVVDIRPDIYHDQDGYCMEKPIDRLVET